MRRIIFLTLIICFIISSFIFADEEEIIVEETTGQELIEMPVKNEIKESPVEYEKDFLDFIKLRTEKFAEQDMCGECHSDIFKQWKGSTHSKAFIDPIWRAATKLFYSESKTIGQVLEIKLCVNCHIPLGFTSNIINLPIDNYNRLMELPEQGAFCNWCHNLKEAVNIGGEGYMDADTTEAYSSTMLGPRDDPRWENPSKDNKAFHPSEYSEFYSKSDFCGLCHNMYQPDNKLPIVQTYDEWKKSPYNTNDPKTTVTCQDCHMRQKPGIPATGSTLRPDNSGQAADGGPYRDNIWTHYFAGGNSIIPKLLGSEMHSYLAIEKLTNSAGLEIIRDSSYEKGKASQIKVKVTNSGAGHYLPTGMTAIRQMWLDMKITDRDGIMIFRSGAMDKEGNFDKNTILFNTVFGNKNGEPVMNFALADKILYDHRIPPMESVIENYSFIIPENTVFPLKVEVILKYRTASPDFVKKLQVDKVSNTEIPVIDMVSLTEKIDL
ncbi:MAG: multiheme c-type cytochrome [bacterium]|nr:multiheme c-type cytochrome [bacterium]